MKQSVKLFTSLLLVTTAVAGCRREPVDVNPNFNPETDQVNAAFALSVSTGSPSTKMSAANVQKANNFLGISDARLFLYSDGEASPYTPFVKRTDGSNFKEEYDLGPVLTPGAISAANNATTSSNRILQLSLPLGADAALFYGRATKTTSDAVQGSMGFYIDKDPSKTYFTVARRIETEDKVKQYDATARLMIYAINTILQSSVEQIAAYSVNGYTCLSNPVPALAWKDLGHQWEINNKATPGCNPYGRTGATVKQSELAKIMGKAYAEFTHIKDGEYRAGSSNAVTYMMQGLFSVVQNTANAVPLNDEEANVIRLANKVITNMNIFFNDNWAYKDINVLKNAIPSSVWDDETTGFKDATNLSGYPYTAFGIPEGAAQLSFDKNTDTFSYMNPNKALVTPGRTFNPRKYVYPPELVYYVNSPLYITAKSNVSVSDFPNGTGPWTNTSEEGKWKTNHWTIGSVASDTRGVAIRDNIHYGVALLETNVTWTSEAASSGLNDNRHAMTGGDETDRTIPVSEANFELRGVLIGGVHPRYNWQFIPRPLTTEEDAMYIDDETTNPEKKIYGTFDGVIYDNTIPSTAIPTEQPNYTVVFDNYDYIKGDNEQQNDVYVALEFVNKGDAFWGRDNLIPSGGVFYLGAKLTVNPASLNNSNTTQTISWPADHQVPPIYESGDNRGQSKQIPRVFIQDFLTKATFRIGVNSLHYAYYSVPDLATSQMSFGLSVDLSWASGYEYDIEFGANPGPGI